MYGQLTLNGCLRLGISHLLALFVLFTPIQGFAEGLDLLTHATIETKTVAEMEELFAVTERVMLNPRLYGFFNTVFSEQLQIPAELQEQYGWPPKAKGLSSTQVMFILHNVRDYWHHLDEYEAKVNETNFARPEVAAYRRDMRAFIKNEIVRQNKDAELAKLNGPTQPVLLKVKGQATGYSALEPYLNHPALSNPDDSKSKIIPPDDLQQVALDFIKGANHSVMSNVFEFNLPKMADEFIAASKRGVDVTVGIDKNTTTLDERNVHVTSTLTGAESAKMKTVLVDPTGLNHQKIIVRDWGKPTAAVLFLSGNFTQSCIGAEGDAVHLEPSLRPATSLPNTNNAVLIKGRIPAIVTHYQLRKTLVHKLRGQSKYPIDGSYLIQGPPQGGQNGFVVIAFSPNGGMGSVNEDLLQQVILRSRGPMIFKQFAFSSQILIDAIIRKLDENKKAGQPADLRMIGDPPFAMQGWSAFLELSGLVRTEAKEYIPTPDMPIRALFKTDAEFAEFTQGLRVDPRTFGEKHEKVNGENVKITRKIHDKVAIFPEMNLIVAGTSFNFSTNAEGNQEQAVLMLDEKVTKRMLGGFNYLYNKSPYSVADYAARRNKWVLPEPGPNELEGNQAVRLGTKQSCERAVGARK